MGFSAALRRHWPEYLIEAFLLGAFMVSALGFTVLLEHPASPARAALPDPTLRRALMGCAMGATAIVLVCSPFGQRSGAHFNPAFTLAFLRLGKIEPVDALGYVAAQFAGGVVGVLAVAAALGMLVAAPSVNYAVTVPGAAGVAAAFAGEALISCATMLTVLAVSNHARLARYTPLFVGALVATWITFEAPLSGMSMNPARSFASAAGAQLFTSLWLYFTAPLAGMLLAAELFVRARGLRAVHCAKLHHQNAQRCIFRCGYGTGLEEAAGGPPSLRLQESVDVASAPTGLRRPELGSDLSDGRETRSNESRGPAGPPLCAGDITRFLEPEQSGGSAGPAPRPRLGTIT